MNTKMDSQLLGGEERNRSAKYRKVSTRVESTKAMVLKREKSEGRFKTPHQMIS